MKKRSGIGGLLAFLVISIGAGIVGSVLGAGGMSRYEGMYQPPLAPPGWLFPVVWTVLYILMAVAAFLVSRSSVPEKGDALRVWFLQLFVNVLWPVLFFRWEAYWLAFVCLVLLWLLILSTLLQFKEINKIAGYLLVPYLLWVTFAGYLNLAIALNI